MIKGALEHVEEIAEAWKEAQAKYKPHRRAVFVLWTMREVPDLRAALDAHMGHVQMIRQQANQAGANLSGEAVKKLISELRKEGFIAHKSHGRPEAESKKVKDALKQSGYDLNDPAPVRLSKEQKLLELLKQQGFSDKDVRAMLDQYEQELGKPPNLQPRPSPSPEPSEKPDTEQIPAGLYGVLIVGWCNGANSIIAQAYLELVRAWTANFNRSWTFVRVDSAGLMIDSAFRRGPGKLAADEQLTPGGKPCNLPALEALFGPHKYFQTTDFPHEKEAIFQRVMAHKRRGVREDDFTRYEYILCFDDDTLKKLRRLANLAQQEHAAEPNKSTILNIGSQKKLSNKGDYQEKVQEVRNNVKGFLQNTLMWSRPPCAIASAPNRTLFFYIKAREHRNALLSNRGAGVKKMQNETKCRIHLAWQNGDLGWVVAVVGSKEALKDAQSSIQRFVANPQ